MTSYILSNNKRYAEPIIICIFTLNIFVKQEVAHNSPARSCNDNDFNQHAFTKQVKSNFKQSIVSC